MNYYDHKNRKLYEALGIIVYLIIPKDQSADDFGIIN